MKRHLLLLLNIGLLHFGANAQATPPPPSARRPAPTLLSEPALQPAATSATLVSAAGTRYRYQLLKIDDEQVFLAPAWRGLTRLTPELEQTKQKKRATVTLKPGELDDLVMQTLNILTEEGWELVEVHSVVQPLSTTQKTETYLPFMDPSRPEYTTSTTVQTHTETRYLLRQPIGK